MGKLNLNWQPWMYGLLSSLIGGGAGAVSAAIGVNLIDPKDWNFTEHPGHVFALMGVCFAINGAISTFAYLSKSPLPSVETVVTEKTTNIQPSGDGVKATVVTKQTSSSELKP